MVKQLQGQGYSFYTFASKEDLQDFYVSLNKHISNALNNGWRLKEAIDYNLYK